MQIDLKKLSCRHIDAAGVGLCLVLALVLYAVGLNPLLQQQDDLDLRRAELSLQQRKADRLSATRIAVGEQLAIAQQSLTTVKLELLPAGQINRRIAEVSDIAAKSGLKIDDIQPGKTLAGPRYEMVPISVAGTGDYTTCLGFLHKLRKALPDTGVSALELGGNPSDPEGKAQFRFELLWYAAPRSAL